MLTFDDYSVDYDYLRYKNLRDWVAQRDVLIQRAREATTNWFGEIEDLDEDPRIPDGR